MKGLRQALDGSVIWENGSRTLGGKLIEPAGAYPYPPPTGGTLVEIATETPLQSGLPQPPTPILQTPGNVGPFPPGVGAPVPQKVIEPPTAPTTTVPAAATPAAEAPSPLATAQGWWTNLSPGGKVVTGVGALAVLGLIVRGAAK